MNKRYSKILMVIGILFLMTACREIVPTATGIQPTDTQIPTVTAVPTVVPTRTPRPSNTATNIPEPTLEPTVPPIRIFLNDLERMSSVYPESVKIVKAEDVAPMVNAALGISIDFPVNYVLEIQNKPGEGSWNLIGGGLDDNRLLSVSVGIFPSANAPGLADVESWYTPNPAGSIKTSEESFEYENGFSVLFSELYPYKGHYGMDVISTVVLDFDEQNAIGIEFYLSEEIYSEVEIDDAIDAGKVFVQQMQASYQSFDEDAGGIGESSYRMLTGFCPIESDESYGYTMENPILMTEVMDDPVMAALLGPGIAAQFFETLVYNDEPVQYVRLRSITTDETILDEYQVTIAGGSDMILYVDQYNSAPYRVPADFSCTGILNPEFLMEFEEE